MSHFILWLKNTRGATAIEYGMIVVAIAIAISVIVFTMGEDITQIFTNADDRIQSRLD